MKDGSETPGEGGVSSGKEAKLPLGWAGVQLNPLRDESLARK